jgi:DtxR family Mn-dependent transcriptional regulator
MDPQIEELLERLYLRQFEHADMAEESSSGVLDAAASAGLIARDEKGAIHLSTAGENAARDVVRRHRLAECLLHDVLKVREEDLDAEACEFEHILQRGLDEKICILLNHPAACPHGKPIPPGECCRKVKSAIREVRPLCDGETDHEGTVVYLHTADQQETQKLMAIGVLPGVRIKLLRRFPCFVFEVGFSQFAVDEDLAKKIYVHWNAAATGTPNSCGRSGRRFWRWRRRGS